MKRRISIVVILALIISLLPIKVDTVQAAPSTTTIFISKDGDDSADGTAERPFATLAKAITRANISDTPVRILLLSDIVETRAVGIGGSTIVGLYSGNPDGTIKKADPYSITFTNPHDVRYFYVYGQLTVGMINFIVPEQAFENGFSLFYAEDYTKISLMEGTSICEILRDVIKADDGNSSIYLNNASIMNNPGFFIGAYDEDSMHPYNIYIKDSNIEHIFNYRYFTDYKTNIHYEGDIISDKVDVTDHVTIDGPITSASSSSIRFKRRNPINYDQEPYLTYDSTVFYAKGGEDYQIQQSDLEKMSTLDDSKEGYIFTLVDNGIYYLNPSNPKLHFLEINSNNELDRMTYAIPDANGNGIFYMIGLVDYSQFPISYETEGKSKLLLDGNEVSTDYLSLSDLTGSNKKRITCRSLDESTKDYTFDTKVKGITDFGFELIDTRCIGKVPEAKTVDVTVYTDLTQDLSKLKPTYTMAEGYTLYKPAGDTLSRDDSNKFTAEDTIDLSNNNTVTLYAAASNTDFFAYTFHAKDLSELTSDITEYSINGVHGTIENTAHTINVQLPYGTDVTQLIPEFKLSDGAKITMNGTPAVSMASTVDFSQDVLYQVTGLNGSVTNYIVHVTVLPQSYYSITYMDEDNVTELTNLLPASYDNMKVYAENEGLATIDQSAPYFAKYRFLGWYDSIFGGRQMTRISTMTNKNITLYAHWEKLPEYKVTFFDDDGSALYDRLGYEYQEITTYTEGFEQAIPQSTPYAKTGYHFLGWFSQQEAGENVTSISETSKGDVVLYAHWEKDPDPTVTPIPTVTTVPTEITPVPTNLTPEPSTVTPEPSTITPEPIDPSTPIIIIPIPPAPVVPVPSVSTTPTVTPSVSVTPMPSVTTTPTTTPNKKAWPIKVRTAKLQKQTKSKDGFYYNEAGKKLTSTMILTSFGNLAALDENGTMVKSVMIENYNMLTRKTEFYYAGSKGACLKNYVFKAPDQTRYFVGENRQMVKNDFITTSYGNLCYASEDGSLMQSTKFKAKDGNMYYAYQSGKIAKSRIITYKGKRYYATKSGKLAISKWIRVNDKAYYCNRYGYIIKEK